MKKSTDYRKILGMITDEQVLALEQAECTRIEARLNEHIVRYRLDQERRTGESIADGCG